MADATIAAAEALEMMRRKNPVVHSITNYVVMNSTANVLLSIGAAPIMSHAMEELEEIVSIANSVVINIGTLSKPWIESMNVAARLSKAMEKNLVLDPVGAGATQLRTNTAHEILTQSTPTVVRGNASEIMSLAAAGGTTRGVDSVNRSDEAFEAAKSIAQKTGAVVAATGAQDFITNGSESYVVSNGHPLLSKVTGTGCAATVTIAAFLASDMDPCVATAGALAYFGLAGEHAAKNANGPGSFWVNMIDALYNITPDQLAREARIQPI